MNNKSKYLEIRDVTEEVRRMNGRDKKTRDFIVLNKKTGDILGYINYYPPFRKYAYTSRGDIVYDRACLSDILEFVSNVERERVAIIGEQ